MSIDYLKGEQDVASIRLPVYAIGEGVVLQRLSRRTDADWNAAPPEWRKGISKKPQNCVTRPAGHLRLIVARTGICDRGSGLFITVRGVSVFIDSITWATWEFAIL